MPQTGMNKKDVYEQISKEILAVLEGEENFVARMSTIACLLHPAFENRIWSGFYIVDNQKERELIVGPYQGTLGCLRIPFGKGVCGVAAATLETQIVEDVHAFSTHISCDSNSVSEIVVPVTDKNGKLLAVLDIDSTEHGAFDDIDKQALESLMTQIFAS